MYALHIATTPPLVWTEPDITAVGSERSAINGEVPNMAITIDNARGQHTAALAASSVLRLRAQLLLDGVAVFSGAVQSVGVGAEISIDIEA